MPLLRKKGSVSATALADMVYCEASVNGERIYTSEDKERIRRGNNEHLHYEKSLYKGKKLGRTHRVRRSHRMLYVLLVLGLIILAGVLAHTGFSK